jgi:hypothetical protein
MKLREIESHNLLPHTDLNYESIAAAEEAAAQAQAEHTSTNPQQPKPRPPSGFYGVNASGKRWQARINYDSKKRNLGSFDTKQEAALAYDTEARQRGKDKPLNYESIKAAEEQRRRRSFFLLSSEPAPAGERTPRDERTC